jgi:DNA-binding protein HU-beta
MNKKDFIDQLATELNYSKADAKNIVNTFVDLMISSIRKSDKAGFRMANFGIFYLKTRAARKGKNPKTAEVINIPAQNVVTFKVSKSLKDCINPEQANH